MLFAKFGWNWPDGSGEEDFKISSKYCRYFVIIFPSKRAFIWINLGCFVPSLVEIGPVVLLISSMYLLLFYNYLPLKKGMALHLNKIEYQ